MADNQDELNETMKILTFQDIHEKHPSKYTPFRLTGRYEINAYGQFLLIPDEGSSLGPVKWSAFTPNALSPGQVMAITSGTLYFSYADPRGRADLSPRIYQFAGIWDPGVSMFAGDVLDKIVAEFLNNAIRKP